MRFKVKATEVYTWWKTIEADSIENLEILLEDEFTERFDLCDADFDRDWEIKEK